MDDVEIVHRTAELADEEHRLERSHVGEGLSEEELARLSSIEVALDQCWTSSGNVAPAAPRDRTPTTPWPGRKQWSRDISNERPHRRSHKSQRMWMSSTLSSP